MRLLFIHQNFPGQFLHIVNHLAKQPGVSAIGLRQGAGEDKTYGNLKVIHWKPDIKPYGQGLASDYESKIIRGIAVARTCEKLKADGFEPDIVVAHPGWGEAMFIKTVFPDARLIVHGEYHYGGPLSDTGFDPEFPADAIGRYCGMSKNAAINMGLIDADVIVAPTPYQAALMPPIFQPRIRIIHEGIDTRTIAPKPDASFTLGRAPRPVTRRDRIVTFINRHFEPTRGYHSFMRALPAVMEADKELRVVLVGSDGVSYGKAPEDGRSHKELYLAEVRERIDMERIHFVGRVSREVLTTVLQVSTVHVYLTIPFVLSWSLMEAMACEGCVIGSDTAPVRDAITHGETGYLVDFFDYAAIAEEIVRCVNDEARQDRVRRAARRFVVDNYDLATICLPAWIKLIEETMRSPASPPRPVAGSIRADLPSAVS